MATKRALISVSDKTGIIEFAKQLVALDFEILSTGGTLEHLLKNKVPATSVADITEFPEILDGRVKTLHPKIHGGLLARRDDPEHIRQINVHGILGIDLLCVNLYPFASTINKPDCTLDDAIENIDIGGPAMIRAASKNYRHVIVVTDPTDYQLVLDQLRTQINQDYRLELAQKAFSHTAYYDSLISNYLQTRILADGIQFSHELTIPLQLQQQLRYGENSHQQAAFYRDHGSIDGLLASFKQLQGKELSYNNLVDTDTAWECVKQFSDPACVIVKHANPCGVAIGDNIFDSYKRAFASDPVSSFGGIIAFNQHVDAKTIDAVSKQFLEVLVAPSYSKDALLILANKPNVRVLEIKVTGATNKFDYKRVGGGVLVQVPETKALELDELEVVTDLKPDEVILRDLEFAWQVARFVKSNAIVLVKNRQTIGIGAGQMSRIDSTKIAITKAKDYGFDPVGSVCASDAFFPFRDNVDLLGESGVNAIIQPGGSIKDAEVFAAANQLAMIMVLTGYRAFRH